MKTTLKVTGMTCTNCEATVKEALEKQTGIENVEVNLDTGEVNITADESQVNVEEMKEVVKEAGYEVA